MLPRGRELAYVGGILGLGAVFLLCVGIAVARITGTEGGTPPFAAPALALAAMVLAAPLMIWFARDLVHLMLYAVLAAPTPMPELELEPDGQLPASLATCAVYPVIVHEKPDIDALLATMLATRDEGGPGPVAHLALVDFCDNPTRYCDSDRDLRGEIEARLAAVGREGASQPLLAALFRERRWNPVEQIWMGWERKRGKLMEFIDLMIDGPDAATSYLLDQPADRALVERLRGIRYLLTLDVGSRLSPGGVRRLVATAAHPDAAAVVDEMTGTMVSGYSIVRPHQALKMWPTFFGWAMYNGPPARPSPSIGQQVFGYDVFFGQGLIDVTAIRATVRGHIPENSVLSHDKLEAVHAGAACQTEVALVDLTPADYLSFRRRYHRWIRGDYHLVPWIFGHGGGPGTPGRRSLSLLGRWRLMEDLFGHSHSVSAVSMLVLGWLVAPTAYVGTWTLTVLALLVESVLTEPLTFLVRRYRWVVGDAGRFTIVTRAMVTEAIRWALWVVLLADRALLTLDAAVRAMYRTVISHRHILQWTSFAQTSRGTGTDNGWRPWWWQMWPGPAVALAAAGLVSVVNPPALPWAAPVLTLWTVAPIVAEWASRPWRKLPEANS